MRNKLLLALLSIVCALCCVFGFAACDSFGHTFPNEIKLNKTSLTMNVGDTETLIATVLPENASEKEVYWESDKPYVADVDDNGKVTAMSPGEATIVAVGYNNIEARCVVTVTLNLKFDKTSLTMEVGQSQTLSVANPEHFEGSPDVTVSPQDIVEIRKLGSGDWSVKALAEGSATITISVDGLTATCAVTVTIPTIEVESVTLSKSTLSMYVGDETTLRADVTPSDATDKTVTWSVEPAGIVTVDNGKVTAVAQGVATITAAAGSKSATCDVTVASSETLLAMKLTSDKTGYVVAGIGKSEDTDIVIPSVYKGLPVTQIGAQAFDGCSSLTSVTIPDSIKSILDNAFRGCSSLTGIEIPDSVTSVGSGAFGNCPIETATIPALAASRINNSKLKTVVITSGDSIEYEAFRYCAALTSVTIPTGVKKIGGYAFSGCGFTSITIPNSVTSIEGSAFKNCTSLTSITIPDSVTSIGSEAFSGCSSIESATIPAFAIKDIPKTNLKTVVITSGDSIGYQAFYNCSSLTNITIPDSITSIGGSAFDGCSSLEYNEYDNALYLGNTDNPYVVLIKAKDTNITSCAVHGNTKLIYGGAFSYCTSLTSVTMPNSVTSIGDGAFYGCNSLEYNEYDNALYLGSTGNPYAVLVAAKDKNITSCVIHDNTKFIVPSAFYGCRSLASVTIGSGVTSIGGNAFYDCNSLASIIYTGDMAGWCGISGLAALMQNGDKTLTISGQAISGELVIPDGITSIGDYAFANCELLTSVTIPDSVTEIGTCAFNSCDSLKSITISDSVTSIGNYAFSYCPIESATIPTFAIKDISKTNLKTVVITSGNRIENGAFDGCKSLTSVIIRDGVTGIGDSAFRGCSSLTSITIPNSVTSIVSNSFNNCPIESATLTNYSILYMSSSLKTVVITSERIVNNTFEKCRNIERITIGDGVTTIAAGAFDGLANLEEVTFPQGFDFSHITFNNCPKYKGQPTGDFYLNGTTLTGVRSGVTIAIIPSSIKTIASKAFENKTDIKYVYIPNTVESIASDAFSGCTAIVLVNSLRIVSGTGLTVYNNVGECTDDGWIYSTSGSNASIRGYIGVGGEVTVPAQIEGKKVTEISSAISSGAFLGRSDITKITFASETLSVQAGALANLANLTEIAFGASVTQIEMSKAAFEGCNKLAAISLAGGYDKYQFVTVIQGPDAPVPSDPENITDGADLFAKINGADSEAACAITAK